MNQHKIDEITAYALLSQTADEIAEYYGHDVPYCESMDMSLLDLPINAMLGYELEEGDLNDLRFLAENGRVLPKSLTKGTAEQFHSYCKEHRQEILDEIESICNQYLKEYKEN